MLLVRGYARLLVFAGLFLTGCSSAPSTNRNDYVGEYVLIPADADPGDFANFVVLRRDRMAVEVRFDKVTGEVSTTKTKWYLLHGYNDDVVIGKRGYPIELSGSLIKLNIDGDLGQYYQKVR
jgi:hypothetical protein